MKVNIGRYTNYFGPCEIALKFEWLIGKKRCENLGDFLIEIDWLNRLCQWIDSKKSREIKVTIDPYDTWSLDDTLALIISPALKVLRDTTNSVAYVEDSDIPESLAVVEKLRIDYEDSDDPQGYSEARWNYVLNEMIYAFDAIAAEDGDFFDEYDVIDYDRIQNGLRLFGKYYTSLWD
jgi:hypothetical protein